MGKGIGALDKFGLGLANDLQLNLTDDLILKANV